MKTLEVADAARRLVDAHGAKAEAEAAQKARSHEAAGELDEAAAWRKVQEVIREMRPPHES